MWTRTVPNRDQNALGRVLNEDRISKLKKTMARFTESLGGDHKLEWLDVVWGGKRGEGHNCFHTPEAPQEKATIGLPPDLREFGIGAQILLDLGVRQLRMITGSAARIKGLEGYGMTVVEHVPIPLHDPMPAPIQIHSELTQEFKP